MTYSPSDYLETIHAPKGIGRWRELYLRLLSTDPFCQWESIIELGAGAPDFLARVHFPRRVAVDIGTKHQNAFQRAGVELQLLDLAKDLLLPLGRFDVCVCSDVFEHLLWPKELLDQIPDLLTERGILISHVPNEYRLQPTLLIMAGLRNGMYFHRDMHEWNDPHLRRFTKRGFEAFLAQRFQYNVSISHLRYHLLPRILHQIRLPVPYALEGGPTYISTNSDVTYNVLRSLRRRRLETHKKPWVEFAKKHHGRR